MLRKVLMTVTLSLLTLLAIAVVTGVIFLYTSPEFGGKHSKQDLQRYQETGFFKNGMFHNLSQVNMKMNVKDTYSLILAYIKGTPNARPSSPPPVERISRVEVSKVDSVSKVVWFGHSAFYLQIDGLNILLDPMFGDTPSPHPWLGTKRYQSELPIAIEDLPEIDLLIISHDHYDHLDYSTIQQIKDKTKLFLLPMGVGAHFRSWGIKESSIKEFQWWESYQIETLNISFTPAQHFSGRGLNDRFTTLWGGWVIQGKKDDIFFSGDGGYGTHFEEIGSRYGPFDLALLECGQYNYRWRDIHMTPEETARAAKDLNAEVFMPIHWGSFTLAIHSWTDPIERVLLAAKKTQVRIIHPKIGQKVTLPLSHQYSDTQWWTKGY